MKFSNKTVLITGASAGIGAACAEVFAEAGARLLLLARRADKLKDVADRLFKKYGAEIYNIECDIRNFELLNSLLSNRPERWKNIDVLINNAGLARGMEKIQEGKIEDWEEMLDTNVKGLLYISKLVIPDMVKMGRGHIVNIASIAGSQVYPGGNIYSATKHAVKALSQAMIMDLNGSGVRITNIDPGLTETEFSKVRFRGDSEKASNVYKGYVPLSGRDIAEIVLFCVSRPENVMIQDLLVTPTAQASVGLVARQ